jgi:DNA-directed RNA polymerase delta subunit
MEQRKKPIDLNDVLDFIEKYKDTSEPEILKNLALQMLTHR